jgi:hypothetical protein
MVPPIKELGTWKGYKEGIRRKEPVGIPLLYPYIPYRERIIIKAVLSNPGSFAGKDIRDIRAPVLPRKKDIRQGIRRV